MKYTVILLFCFFIVNKLYCQIQSTNNHSRIIYAEIGGPGLLSLNYDARIGSKKYNGLGFNIGFGRFNSSSFLTEASTYTFPLGLNYLFNQKSKNKFEIGFGFTSVLTNMSKIQSSSTNISNKNNFGYMTFGYRLLPIKRGLVFRATLNPIFNFNNFYPIYGGLSLGYKF
jgi:hypothetical protein